MPKKISLNEFLQRIEEEAKADHSLGLHYVRRPQVMPDKRPLLESLKQKTLTCRLCDLSKTRTNVVFGDGNPYADILFIGEAPGYNEDVQGLPFVGDAGKLLDKNLEAMGLKRSDVYIANIIKCRPPNNRAPLPDEIMACYPHLLRQIETIQPKIIVALGHIAAKTLLKTKASMSEIRGKFFSFSNIPVLPTFHPAYLLRNPADKKKVWEDMQKLLAFLKTGKTET
ncbi:MAG: uracil-DNA glycosylase [Planctomycetota bacterium]|nr:uracil-DNA glycosylase [Planctomycetota bacterium]